MAMAARTDLTATTIHSTRKDPRVEACQSNVITWQFSPPKLDRRLTNCYSFRRSSVHRHSFSTTLSLANVLSSVENKRPSGVWQ
jgi:hypothetical protein